MRLNCRAAMYGWTGVAARVLGAMWLMQTVHAGEVPVSLKAALDDALEERNSPLAQRLDLVAEIDAAIGDDAGGDNPDWVRVRLAEAIALLRLGRIDDSLAAAEFLQSQLEPGVYPILGFRAASLHAALLSLSGDPDASVLAFEALLGEPRDDVPVHLRHRARTNYASALYDVGRPREATVQYERLMLDALAEKRDLPALHAGNNLTTLLIDQGNTAAARRTLDFLEPIVERNADRIGAQLLRAHHYNLLRLEGDHERAMAGLNEYLAAHPDAPPLVEGSVRKFLALALGEREGAESEALAQAQAARALLRERPRGLGDLALLIARIELQRDNHEAALESLDGIDPRAIQTPDRQVRAEQLRLAATLRRDGLLAEAAMLERLLQAESLRDEASATDRDAYFAAQLTAIEETQARERAEVAARATEERAKAERQTNQLLLIVLGVAGIGGCGVVYLLMSRRQAREALNMEQAQNERLERRVAEATLQLEANMRTREHMLRALERRKRSEQVARLAGEMAHNVNNVLQVVASANESLAKDGVPEEARQTTLEVSNSSIRYGVEMVQRLLKLSQPDQSEQSERSFGSTTALTLDSQAVDRLSNLRVLLVEDDDGVADMLVATLRDMVARVERVASGEAACERLERQPGFDVVLSDVRMPGRVNGAALAGWIREHHPGLRVGLMSGYNDVYSAELGVPMIRKPFDTPALAQFLQHELHTTRKAS